MSVYLSLELNSPRSCLAQIEFQRVTIHLHKKRRRRKQSNYIEEPARVYKITRRRHAGGVEEKKKGQMLAVNLLMWWRIRAVIELNAVAGGFDCGPALRWRWSEDKAVGVWGWISNMLLLLQRLFKSDAEGTEKQADRRIESSGQHCGTKKGKEKKIQRQSFGNVAPLICCRSHLPDKVSQLTCFTWLLTAE